MTLPDFMSDSPDISVVLPGYNEAENIDAMLAQVSAAVAATGQSFEILYVDDGSRDNSRAVLEEARHVYPHLRVLYHHSNFGQSAAVLTGIENARGGLVITMDSDLQNDPADIPAMIDLLKRENADAVCGVRQKRQDSRVKLMSSRVANRVRGWALNDGITDAGCAMRVMRRSALSQLPAFRALHRFLPTIMQIHGYRVIEMPIRHRAREAGVSKYGVGNRLWVGISDIFGLRWYRKRFLPPGRVGEPDGGVAEHVNSR
jgi:dolichol-phosphate mannosyltransferase